MIPLIIHQIWLQGEYFIPEKFKDYYINNKKLHPNWKYYFWDESDILQLLQQKQEWLDTYYKLQYLVQKVDFARYIILLIYGGVYVDMDAKIIKPLDTLLYKYKDYDLIVSDFRPNILQSLITCGDTNPCINNGIIICKPRSIIMEKLVEYIQNNPECGNIRELCILNVTGPSMFTNIIKKYQHMERIKRLPSEYLEPCVLDENDCLITDNTYVVHIHSMSWMGRFGNICVFIYRYLYLILLVIILCIIYGRNIKK